MQKHLEKLVDQAEVIFWDFDGVIKDSVEVKSAAFEKLFSDYGQNLVDRVRRHHERNGGVSRFEKIPLYLSWSNEIVTDEKVEKFCDRFSLLVKQSVINSPWVPGFLEFIERYYKKRKHILVTATPKEEIEEILKELNIKHFFYKVYGSSTTKKDAINIELKSLNVSSDKAIMFGDSGSDYKATLENKIFFILRRTSLNTKLKNFVEYQITNYL